MHANHIHCMLCGTPLPRCWPRLCPMCALLCKTVAS